MTYTMLGMYSFTQTNETQFEISYEIPDNCNSNILEDKGEYLISIKLNPGETDPSTSFTGVTDTADVIDDSLVVTFEQCERTGTIRKPKLTILEV
ncbi:hypothetical protein [Flavobacterium sp.]|uniref:hypothetical protein n=1 Tax=Flavobacterium sp. TaxID=239 RepID=UPI00262DE3BD|nr:hypothetical protein [Flavobacterium sp.]